MVVFYLREQKDNYNKKISEQFALCEKEENIIDSFYLTSRSNNNWISFSYPYFKKDIDRGTNNLIELIKEFILIGEKVLCYTELSYEYLTTYIGTDNLVLHKGSFQIDKHYDSSDINKVLEMLLK